MNRLAILASVGVCLAHAALGHIVKEFPIPTAGSFPLSVAAGPDGAIWFTENASNKIGRITTAGAMTEFVIPTANSGPTSIVAGADGALWFTEFDANKIGRITTAGAITEFPVVTAGNPLDITAGPDGALWFTEYNGFKIGRITAVSIVQFDIPNEAARIVTGPDGALWFTERAANQIGRITTAGVVTEFAIPTDGSDPFGFTAGPDGALWFTEAAANQIGRVTTAGAITEFPISTAGGGPLGIASGSDGALWFTEATRIGRITTSGVIAEFSIIPTAASGALNITASPDGALWFTENGANKIARFVIGPLGPTGLSVDAAAAAGTSSNTNGVLEPGETVLIRPSWRNDTPATIDFTAGASNPAGPTGAVYSLPDAAAAYAGLAAGAAGGCGSDCYAFTVSNPTLRPATHWDASFTETPAIGGPAWVWTLHVGNSFTDVPASNPFYRFVETIFHKNITAGCGGSNYCPASSTTRQQMAVFVLVAKEGSGYSPPACGSPIFNDVPASSPFCRWIEELSRRGVVAGCGGGSYCPTAAVSRQQMALFTLATLEGSGYAPPACSLPLFQDVSAFSPFCRWIEELARRGVVAGCGNGNYCPADPVTRQQMSVFLASSYGLTLYAP